jgi:RsiW-degrading membrane proteinase PrsW (M82 family)
MYENVQYGVLFGEKVIYIRTVTATLAHMFFGLFFGYWIALSQIDCSKFSDRSVFGVITHKNKRVKFYIYLIIGYLSSVIYHGLWNYNISSSDSSYSSIMILMLVIGFVGSKFGVNDLNEKYRRSLK